MNTVYYIIIFLVIIIIILVIYIIQKINGGKDYVYYLDNRDEVYKRVR